MRNVRYSVCIEIITTPGNCGWGIDIPGCGTVVNFVKKIGSSIVNGASLVGDRVALETLTSPFAEVFYPVASSLLRHAKDKTKLTTNDEKLIRLKVKKSKIWNQEIMGNANAKKIWATWEKAEKRGVKEGQPFFIQDITFAKSDDSDLYYGINRAQLWGIKKGDKIMLYIKDTYDFNNDPGLFNQLGYRLQKRGWLTPYPISVYIMDIPKP